MIWPAINCQRGGGRDDHLIKRLLVQALDVQILGDGIEAAVHGRQGDDARNQKVQIGLSVHGRADAPAEDDQIHKRRHHGGQCDARKITEKFPPFFP